MLDTIEKYLAVSNKDPYFDYFTQCVRHRLHQVSVQMKRKKHFYPQGTLKKNLNGNLIAFASQVGSCENSVLSVTRITMVQRRNNNRIKTEIQPIKNV